MINFANLSVPEILACLAVVGAIEWVVRFLTTQRDTAQHDTDIVPGE